MFKKHIGSHVKGPASVVHQEKLSLLKLSIERGFAIMEWITVPGKIALSNPRRRI
jgi:hypothetical protein